VETEWLAPTFRAWEGYRQRRPSTDPPFRYFVSGAIGGPDTLDPAPTPPTLLQQVDAELQDEPGAVDGAAEFCFGFRVPDPPRDALHLGQMAMVSYWGWPGDGIEVLPGEELRVTQHLVAYMEYPLAVSLPGPFVEDCQPGGVTPVPLAGAIELTHPTAAELRYRWSSPDPAVAFDDATAAEPVALLPGAGTWPVRLTVAVGAFEASAEGEVQVVDLEPPRFVRLEASPARLWPPNHRLVDVAVDVEVEDDCDPAPAVRLVSVASDELELHAGEGSGRTSPDVEDAELGTDDRSVRLRAERAGRRDGRTYTLTYEVEDASGNATLASVDVVVAHDRSRGSTAAPSGRRPGR